MNDNVFITGMGCVTGYGLAVDKLWGGIINGESSIREIQNFNTEKYETHLASIIPEEYRSNALELAISEAIKQSGIENSVNNEKISVIMTSTKDSIDILETDLKTGNITDEILIHKIVEKISCRIKINGEFINISYACASGTIALTRGYDLIKCGEADIVIIIGFDFISDFIFSGFSAYKALSSVPTIPFSENNEGLSLGDGVGVLVLQNNNGLAEILGGSMSNDANHITGPHPEGKGLITAIEKCLKGTGIGAEKISCINAHGTGTLYNDLMEDKAFLHFFDNVPVTTIKSYTGHTLAAAGIIEAIVSVKMIENGIIPGICRQAEKGNDFKSNIVMMNLKKDMDYILSTNSGFGGVNAALLIGKC